MGPGRLGCLQPSNPHSPAAELRQRLAHQGYLWLPGLLPRPDVLAMRRLVLERFAAIGLLQAGSDPADGIAARISNRRRLAQKLAAHLGLGWPGASQAGAAVQPHEAVLMEVVRSSAYDAFCRQRNLWRMVGQLLEAPVHLHRRRLIRFTRPGEPSATGAHYDRTYLRGGTGKILTAWIPLGDTPMEMGGLIYLEGSDRLGRAMEREFESNHGDLPAAERLRAMHRTLEDGGWISRDLAAMADRVGGRWLAANYRAGDVVFHTAHMIHASPDNMDRGKRLRLSTDIRFQSASEAIDQRWGSDWAYNDGL